LSKTDDRGLPAVAQAKVGQRTETHKIDELKFQRVVDPAIIQVIPHRLFEQIKELDKDKIDMLYACANDILTLPAVNNLGQLVRVANPVIWFAVLHDIAHVIKGFLWVEIDVIEEHLYIQAFSVDKKYQTKDGAVNKKLIDYLFNLPIPDKLKQKIKMATINPKAAEKWGWKRSKNALMEINKDELAR
jgi:hypothetical protein